MYVVGPGGKQVLENWVLNVGGDGEAYFLTGLQQRMWRTIRGGAVSSSPNQNLTSPFLSIIMPSFGSLTRGRGHSSIIPPRSPHCCCCCWHHWQAQRLWLHPLATLLRFLPLSGDPLILRSMDKFNLGLFGHGKKGTMFAFWEMCGYFCTDCLSDLSCLLLWLAELAHMSSSWPITGSGQL